MGADEKDVNMMRRAIEEAEKCQPIEPRIPKVGAIIALNGGVLGRMRLVSHVVHEGEN